MRDSIQSSELDEVFTKSPIDKEPPEDIWETIYATWTGLWTDGYGEWDEKQPSEIYPLTYLLSDKREAEIKAQIEAYLNQKIVEELESLVPIIALTDRVTRDHVKERINQLKAKTPE